jgi:DNA-binding NtrC family response regulator
MPEEPTAPQLRVAIASDDRVYRDSLALPLRRHGFVVCLFVPGAVAAPAALDGVDVLVVDTDALTRADLEGISRVRERWPLVEVVAVTGSLPVEEAVEALREGVFTVLQHPVADELLVATIARAGQRHRRAKTRLDELNHARYDGDEAANSGALGQGGEKLEEAP